MKQRRTTALGAVLLLALGGMGGLVVAGADPENPEAVALLAEIVQHQQRHVDTLRVQRQVTADPDADSLVVLAGAVEDLCDARVRLARERSSVADERRAVEEALVALRELHAEAEGMPYHLGPATLGMLRVPILEAELRLLRLAE